MKKEEITTPSVTNSLPYDRSLCRDLRRELWTGCLRTSDLLQPLRMFH